MTRLKSLTNGLQSVLDGLLPSVPEQDENVTVCVEKVQACLQWTQTTQDEIKKCNGRKLIKLYQQCNSIVESLQSLQLPRMKTVIGELTDAGPGVGISNFEVTSVVQYCVC